MAARIEKLQVIQATKEEKDQFWKENSWVMTPNNFLIRVVKYLFESDKEILTNLNVYLQTANSIKNEENFVTFKNLEIYLLNRVKSFCRQNP